MSTQLGYGQNDATAVPFDYAAPASGATITIVPQTSQIVINGGGTVTSVTVTLPLNPANGQRMRISSITAVTGLTLTANTGDSIVSTVSSLTAQQVVEFAYTLYGTGNSITPGTNARSWVRCQ